MSRRRLAQRRKRNHEPRVLTASAPLMPESITILLTSEDCISLLAVLNAALLHHSRLALDAYTVFRTRLAVKDALIAAWPKAVNQ